LQTTGIQPQAAGAQRHLFARFLAAHVQNLVPDGR
jgi:hypothetical protein